MENKKKKLSFPTAFTVLFIVLIIAALLTHWIAAGAYAKLAYDGDTNVFVETFPDGSVEELPATQDTLDQLGITNNIEKFTDGSIYKPIAIPGTYERVEANPQGLREFILSPVSGIQECIDIILFVFMIGGVVGVVNYTGAFNAGIASLSRATKGHEFILIVVVTVLISIGGTTFGMAEETIAFYPILIPVFLAAGYDAMVGIAAIYLGSSIGTMFSTVNPFGPVIASNAAGINFTEGMTFRMIGLVIGTILGIIYIIRYANKVKKDPTKSLTYAQKDEIEAKFLTGTEGDVAPLTARGRIILILFFVSFVIMIWGVSSQDWWFSEMTALFLVSGVLIGIVSGIGEKVFVNKFIEGAADLMSVALIIGVARSVNILLEDGLVSDTILYGMSKFVTGMSPNVFTILMMLVFIILGFFINSSSGLAVLSIPIMAPLADTVGIPREVIISCYMYGLGLISFITPTGLILASLSMVDVTYDKWLKFVMPIMGIIAALAAVLLLVEVHI